MITNGDEPTQVLRRAINPSITTQIAYSAVRARRAGADAAYFVDGIVTLTVD